MTTPTININGKEYTEADLTQEQIFYVQHLVSLNNQIAELSMKLDQANVAKKVFSEKLEVSLKQAEAVEAPATEQ